MDETIVHLHYCNAAWWISQITKKSTNCSGHLSSPSTKNVADIYFQKSQLRITEVVLKNAAPGHQTRGKNNNTQ